MCDNKERTISSIKRALFCELSGDEGLANMLGVPPHVQTEEIGLLVVDPPGSSSPISTADVPEKKYKQIPALKIRNLESGEPPLGDTERRCLLTYYLRVVEPGVLFLPFVVSCTYKPNTSCSSFSARLA